MKSTKMFEVAFTQVYTELTAVKVMPIVKN